MSLIRPVSFIVFCLAAVLMYKSSEAKWCEVKSQAEPQVFETYKYAVDIFESWNKSDTKDFVLGNKIAALISGYSFYLQDEDLAGYSDNTLNNLQKVIKIIKTENTVFENEPFRARKEKYIKFEGTINKIIECRVAERKKKARHLLEVKDD